MQQSTSQCVLYRADMMQLSKPTTEFIPIGTLVQKRKTGDPQGMPVDVCPIGESNPCFGLERATS